MLRPPPSSPVRTRALSALAAVALLLGTAIGTALPATAGPSATRGQASSSFPALIPEPVSVTPQPGRPFILTRSTRIIASGSAGDAAQLLAHDLRRSTDLPLRVATHGSGRSAISIDVHTGGAPRGHEAEGYRLEVTQRGVRIEASRREGALQAVRTLEQLFGPWSTANSSIAAPSLSAPAVRILDHPRFSYRGFGLDVTRSFYGVDEVEQVIDRASRVKLNVLHLHLSDDQGWRIAIDGRADDTTGIDYSRLTSISGSTAMTEDSTGNPMGTEPGRSGFYTRSEYERIVHYAHDHGVTVVPEIDVPGHTNAALHAIPELNSAGSLPRPPSGEQTPPANGTPDVGYSSLDVDNPASAEFVATVMSELAAMTPGPYLHMGGDESHSTPQDDYRRMVTGYAQTVADTGKTVIGWNEYAAADLPEGAVVQYWNGDKTDAAQDILRNNSRAILSPADRAYIPQKADAGQDRGGTWACGGPCSLEDWYAWDPASELPGIGEDRILGVEAVHWGEWIRGLDQMDDYAWPRALATAETGWSPQAARETAGFVDRAGAYAPTMQLAGMNPHPLSEIVARNVVSAGLSRHHGDRTVQVRASALSADPGAVSARLVDRSGRRCAIALSPEADLSAPMIESSAFAGAAPTPRRLHGARVELLVDGRVVARSGPID